MYDKVPLCTCVRLYYDPLRDVYEILREGHSVYFMGEIEMRDNHGDDRMETADSS